MFIFGLGFFLAVGICELYGRIGGDEELRRRYRIPCAILHFVHHWWLGLVIFGLNYFVSLEILYGFGLGLFIDDKIYHTVKG